MTTTPKTPAEVERLVCETIADFAAEGKPVVREASLTELDVDSLDLVELAQIVEENLGVCVEASEFDKVTVVGDAIDVVLAKLPEAART